ncbi:Catechol O-methyltransferase [Durusdinium trenchii]|uniref:Catechol O-methyltransferase n=1 Tax=Durusdinium trenchii TaxID=1381693 RepID=A0ABP0QZY4_9DINO
MRVEVPSSRDAAVALRRAAPEECVARLRELRGQSLELNVFHAASVLTACRGQWRWALEVLGELEGLAVEGDDVSSSAAVACCRDHWEMALALLMHFHRQNTWNLRTHGAVLSACAAAQRWQDAWSLLTWLEDAELQADVVSYGTAINACDWQQALKLLEVMESKRCEANQVCYTAAMTSGPPWPVVLQLFTAKRADRPALNAALSALARARERSLCLELLRSVRSADRSSYNIAITACGEDGWPWALHLLHELGDDADPTSVARAIGSCEALGRWRIALALLKDQKDPACLRAAISSCGASAQWQRALQLLNRLDHLEIFCGTAAVSACGNAGRWDVALSLVHEFRPVLNTFAFAALLMACGNAQRWQTAVLLLGTSEDFSVESNAFCYSAAISACGKASEWPHAVALLGRMRDGFVEPNEICLNAALSACERAACWRQALLLASQSPRTDAAGLHVLLCCAERVGHWTLALSLLAQHPAVSASALDAACMACCRAQRWEEAIWLADELLEQPRPGKRLEVLAALKNVFERGHPERSQELLLGLAEHASSKEFPAGLPQVLRSAAAVERGDMKVLMVGLRQALGPIAATGRLPYQKEVALLRHVLRFAQFGRANEVEEAMDSFGGELGAAGGWAKFAGGSKADVLLHAVSGAPTSSILDVGAYCGGSALRLSRRFAGAHVVAIELDPTVAAMAKVLLSFAGLSSRVELRTGHSRQLLPQLKHRFGAVFLDLWGSQYAEVLSLLRGRLVPGAVLVADNVLRTAAGEFLWRLAHHGAAPGFHTQVMPVTEVVKQDEEDWMSVTVVNRGDANIFEVPPSIRELQGNSERWRQRATNVGMEPEATDVYPSPL